MRERKLHGEGLCFLLRARDARCKKDIPFLIKLFGGLPVIQHYVVAWCANVAEVLLLVVNK